MANQSNHHPDSALIDELGGTSKAAKFFCVSAASVSEWRKTGLPKARRMYLHLARPDLFDSSATPAIKNRRAGDRKPGKR